MSSNWNAVWDSHPDIFIARNWQECPEEKRKAWRLPAQFSYFMSGETALRVGIVASVHIPQEEDFLLAGTLWGNRLSNGAKTVVYFVAPNFSPFFLHMFQKIGGFLSFRAAYWREKLSPSLYLIPDNAPTTVRCSLGEERPTWRQWEQALNPVARQQLAVVRDYFMGLAQRRVRTEIKSQSISFLYGNIEVAEIRLKGKKFELMGRAKWERNPEKVRRWQKTGWVDAGGSLNLDFRSAIEEMLEELGKQETGGELRPRDILALKLYNSDGVLSTLWGKTWDWPWLPKERGEVWLNGLSQWFYFQGNGQISIVCPVLEKPLAEASSSVLLTGVLEKTYLLSQAKNNFDDSLVWDGRINWLTVPYLEEELQRWHLWLKNPDQFPIWVLPPNWQRQSLTEITCRSLQGNDSFMREVFR